MVFSTSLHKRKDLSIIQKENTFELFNNSKKQTFNFYWIISISKSTKGDKIESQEVVLFLFLTSYIWSHCLKKTIGLKILLKNV
jgi:hypothetical protein